MEITIGKQKQELNFGVRFVNELDNVIGVKRDGISLGFGLTKSIPALQAYDTAVLAQVLYCATFPNSPRASLESIYDYIDNPETDIEGLFKEVNKELKKANAVKLALKNMKAQMANEKDQAMKNIAKLFYFRQLIQALLLSKKLNV